MKGSYRTKTGNINSTPLQSSKGSTSTATNSSKEDDLYEPPCKDLEKLIRELWDSQESKEMLCRLSWVKHWDILLETVLEYEWKGDFVWILPARGCDYYE